MNKTDRDLAVETQIATTAEQILADELGIVEGCRRLVRLFHRLELSDEELLTPIIAVESETEDLLLGESRSYWPKEEVQRRDEDVASYVHQVRDVIREVCTELVRRYS